MTGGLRAAAAAGRADAEWQLDGAAVHLWEARWGWDKCSRGVVTGGEGVFAATA